MDKKWEVSERFPEDFGIKNRSFNEIILQLLWNRGLKDGKNIHSFLVPDLDHDLIDPLEFRNMSAAVDLLIKHIKNQGKITVYGDYDADGVTAAALMVETLGILRADVEVYIPHRVAEGYGLNVDAVEKIAESGTKIIVTVDGGIRGREEVGRARELGLDILITDHHPAPVDKADWPDCLIVNPVIEGESYPYPHLAGVGVAYKLAVALIRRSKLTESDKEKLEERILDLVAIGTVADCVNILGENRTLVKYGLEVLNDTKRTGLSELVKVARLKNNRSLDTWNIGFQIAPRLNAAGRMGRANTAYELLVTRDIDEAVALAARLSERNIDRQRQTEEITAAVIEQIGEDTKDRIIIGVCPENQSEDIEDWNEGVIGLVAGRIASRYYLPTLVITKTADGYKGSGRSIQEFNLAEAIEQCSSLLAKYGGHPMACGFSLSADRLDAFKKKLTAIANKALGDLDLRPKINIEVAVPLKDWDLPLLEQIESFAPFGQKNERPLFVSYGVMIADILRMGVDGQHLKLRLKDEESGLVTALGFGQSETWSHLQTGDKIDIVYYVEINEFNGRREPQLKIVDIKPHGVQPTA